MATIKMLYKQKYEICRTVLDNNGEPVKTDYIGNLPLEQIITFFKQKFNESNPRIQRAYKESETIIWSYRKFYWKK